MKANWPGFRRAALAAVCAVQVVSATATAQVTDVDTTNFVDLTAGINGTTSARAQTFTVGVSGLLASVAPLVRRNPSYTSGDYLHWDIRPLLAEVPAASSLSAVASGTMAVASLPETFTFASLDVSSFGISVQPGDVFAVVVYGETVNATTFTGGSTGNPYPGGGAFYGSISGTNFSWSPYVGWDFGLQTTVTAIPEPATTAAWLGLAGLAAVWTRRRRPS